MKSNATYILALAVGVILVAGALTLPLAFDDHHMADAKKKKSKKYHGKKQKVEFENESGHGGAGGAAVAQVLLVLAETELPEMVALL